MSDLYMARYEAAKLERQSRSRQLLLLIVIVALGLFAVFCGPKAADTQARTAAAIAVGTNVMAPLLRDIEQLEGDKAIDTAPDKATAQLRVLVVEAKWKPVWEAYRGLQIAEDAWATVLEKGGDRQATYAALERAFCGLVPLVPKTVHVAPIAGVICQGASDAGPIDGAAKG